MTVLSIDIETFSSYDLKKTGLYRYIEAPDFEVLMFAYAFDDEPVAIVDLKQGEKLPARVVNALTDESVTLKAFNAAFEMNCLNKHFGGLIELPPERWHCTMVHSFTLGLPGSLEKVGKVLKLPIQKDSAGGALIRFFSKPCKATKVNGGRTRNLPEHAPEKWEDFKSYCMQDVDAERAIAQKLDRFPIPEQEKRLWYLDQRINQRGVLADSEFIDQAILGDELYKERLIREATELTGLDNPNSVKQLKVWLNNATELEVTSLTKKTVPIFLEQVEDETVHRVLELRQELAKTSIRKYTAMERSLCDDSRLRGLLQFYGASRTGRWAGRIVQVQNLPRNYVKDIELVRDLVRAGHFDAVEMLYDSFPDMLSQLIRTAFVADKGHRLIVSDFSAIEARVIAWLAGEKWRLDVFRTHGKIYEASASEMFHVPLEEITKALRQRGKVAELALGFQGGPNALINMGALDQGLSEDELPGIVDRWRKASPNIVKLWKDLARAAKKAVQERTVVKLHHGIAFSYEAGMLFMHLPSGRRLTYVRPKLEEGKFGPQITYEGTRDSGAWGRIPTYGGKFAENLVQATARDCLAVSMERVANAGYSIVFHVHDELVCEEPEGRGSLDELISIMSQPISWAKGLPLNAAGFETPFYMKED